AVFHIASFNRSTTQRISQALADAQQQAGGQLRGIVLDLRGSPGGLLDQAVSLADLFIADGPIVSTVGRHPASHQYFAASRAGIDERAWSELRRLCPGRRTNPGIDLKLAKRVLADPVLYGQALHALSVTAQLGESTPAGQSLP